MSQRYDLLVIGEVLLELSSPQPLREARDFRLSFSGDVLNAAVAAATAGGRVGIVTRVGDDELGTALVDAVTAMGIDTALVRRGPEPTGLYFAAADPHGVREFLYWRHGSAASRLEPADVPERAAREAGSLLAGGVAYAVSPSAAAAVRHATTLAREGGARVVYDPNFRAKLTTPAAAREAFAWMAPGAALVTPSWPGDATALFGPGGPEDAARAALAAGASAVAVTMGGDGLLLDDGTGPRRLPAVPAPAIVDATGCGDAFAGTVSARLALGDDLDTAVAVGMSAAALSLGGQGGIGHVATIEQARGHLDGLVRNGRLGQETHARLAAARETLYDRSPRGDHQEEDRA